MQIYYVVAIRTNCTMCQLMNTISHSWDTDGVYYPLIQSVEHKFTLYLIFFFGGGGVKPVHELNDCFKQDTSTAVIA